MYLLTKEYKAMFVVKPIYIHILINGHFVNLSITSTVQPRGVADATVAARWALAEDSSDGRHIPAGHEEHVTWLRSRGRRLAPLVAGTKVRRKCCVVARLAGVTGGSQCHCVLSGFVHFI